MCSEFNKTNVPRDELYYIKDSVLNVEENLEIKTTSNYEKMFDHQTNKKHITIWKPTAPINYRCIG